MGATMRLNSAQLWNGPARPGGSQKATVKEGINNAHPGDKGAGITVRETPFNQHGVDGRVEPSASQPSGTVHSS